MELILKYATEFGVDQNLIAAIMHVESGGHALCMRYEPSVFTSYNQNVSVTDDARQFAANTRVSFETEMMLRSSSLGVLQVLGQVARELGHKGPLLDLCIPEIGLRLGVMKLKELMIRYHGWEPDVVAAYNAGSARRLSTGEYFNQSYLNKVNLELERLRAFP